MMLVMPSMVDAHGNCEGCGRLHGVQGYLEAAIGAVLEADGHGKPAGHLAMSLRFGGARSNSSPGDEVGDVLGMMGSRNSDGCRQPDGMKFKSRRPGFFQTRIDIITPFAWKWGRLINPFQPMVVRGFSK